jgi:hypothetical protein
MVPKVNFYWMVPKVKRYKMVLKVNLYWMVPNK